jgi:hypothetical protein
MLILLLIRRLSPRGRMITGVALLAAGAVLAGVSAVLSIGLFVHGIMLMVIGAVLGASVIVGKRRARAEQPGANGQPTFAGSSRVL